MKDEGKEAEGGNQAPKAPLAISYRSPGTYLHSGKNINKIWQKFPSYLFTSCLYELYISNHGIICLMYSKDGHAKLYHRFSFISLSISSFFLKFSLSLCVDNECLWLSFCLFSSPAIVSTLKQIPTELLEKVSTEPQMVRTIAFGLGVIQGMLVARQLFGAQGLNQWYPFNQVQMEQALVALTGKMLKSEEQQAPKVDNMVEIFAKVSWKLLGLAQF